jgi:phosphatidylserine/phosphatidylglycerophosphate/cardiolipin synthase-like enzyme
MLATAPTQKSTPTAWAASASVTTFRKQGLQKLISRPLGLTYHCIAYCSRTPENELPMAETDSTTAPPTKHVVPMLRGQNSAAITPPWFVDRSEYTPKLASFKPLVNGEAAFREVYLAIEAAKKDVCIICWGFQPSMYFIRDGQHLMIGKLLEKKAREGVMVRILCWAYQISESDRVNVTGAVIGESNTPARWSWMPGSRPESSSDAQHAYDEQFYNIYDRKQSHIGELGRRYIISDDFPKDKLYFTSRSYSASDKAEVGAINYLDQGISSSTKFALKWAPSHHQKLVLVDHSDPDKALGFVMGHNMLDGYWDKSDHSSARQAPDRGRNGANPLHDYSSRVTGPIVGDLFRNFSSAWQRETSEAIPLPAFCVFRKSVTDDFGIVTGDFGNVTGHFGAVTEANF